MSNYLVITVSVFVLVHVADLLMRWLRKEELSFRSDLWPQAVRVAALYAGLAALCLGLFASYGAQSTKFQFSLIALFVLIGLSAQIRRTAREPSAEPEAGIWAVMQGFLRSWQGAIVFGFFSALVISLPIWWDKREVLTAVPPKSESSAYLILFGALLIISIGLQVYLNKKTLRKLPSIAHMQRLLNRTFAVPAIFGLMVAFLQNQTRNNLFTSRWYIIALLIWIVSSTLWLLHSFAPGFFARLSEEQRHFATQNKLLKKKRRNRR